MPVNALDSKFLNCRTLSHILWRVVLLKQVTWTQSMLMTTPTRMYVIKLDDPLVYHVDDNSNKNVCHKTWWHFSVLETHWSLTALLWSSMFSHSAAHGDTVVTGHTGHGAERIRRLDVTVREGAAGKRCQVVYCLRRVWGTRFLVGVDSWGSWL